MTDREQFVELMKMSQSEKDPAERKRMRQEARKLAATMQRQIIREREAQQKAQDML